ncbi:xanthine dehydrogenase family protein subunit M [Natranaerobius thermophilus]|uniref:FAD binding domain-containing protein n=1 Tax=Natranaerobius thermophilus TaxID=375929 RepID=UPI002F41CF8E
MILSEFDYLAPESLSEALNILDKADNEPCLLAGGTDVMIHLKEEEIKPQQVINLKQIPELNFIKEENGYIKIGAMTTFSTIEKSNLIQDRAKALAKACGEVGSPQIRNTGTVGGNIVNASPAADSVPALMALDAKVVLANKEGERELALDEFLCGINQTVIKPNEILTHIYFKTPKIDSISEFEKLGRRKALAIARLSVGFYAEVEPENKVLQDVRISLGAVAKNPFRAVEAEEYLKGKKLNEDVITETVEKISEIAAVTLGNRSSAPFKRESIKGVAKKALIKAMDSADKI